MKIPKNKYVSSALVILGFCLAMYQMVNYVGLYRWVADLQLRFFGIYFPLLAMLPCLALTIPGFLLSPDSEAEREDFEWSFATAEELGIYRQRRRLTRLRYFLPLTALASATLFIWSQFLPSAPPPAVTIDLNKPFASAPPTGVPVVVIGTPVMNAMVAVESLGRMPDKAVVPIVGTEGANAPLIFVNPVTYSRIDQGLLINLRQSGRISGVLYKNAMPGELRRSYEKAGIEIPEPHYVLSQNYRSMYSGVILWAWLLASVAMLQLLLLFNARRLIRKFTRELEENY
ncbi:hypothetical protein [Sphingomonas sp.]|uniref:hypothetical protein n=1 Tax=Sphingomonas sp. TaxID=28214 RepID=UPI003D6D2367